MSRMNPALLVRIKKHPGPAAPCRVVQRQIRWWCGCTKTGKHIFTPNTRTLTLHKLHPRYSNAAPSRKVKLEFSAPEASTQVIRPPRSNEPMPNQPQAMKCSSKIIPRIGSLESWAVSGSPARWVGEPGRVGVGVGAGGVVPLLSPLLCEAQPGQWTSVHYDSWTSA